MYYYRPNSRDCILALVSSTPVHLKDNAQITILSTFAGRSLNPFWTHWRCLHSGTSIIMRLKQIAKMLHVQIYFKIRFLASTWEKIQSMLKYLKIIATKFNQLCEMWSQPKVTLNRKKNYFSSHCTEPDGTTGRLRTRKDRVLQSCVNLLMYATRIL